MTQKIMLIDDDEGMHVLVSKLVREAGYDFCSARSGEEGLRFADSEEPDLILIDVMMPSMNGFDVCRKLRDGGSRVPVVFLTAKGDIVDKSTGFGVGADDYVVKPFHPQELLLRIEAHLRRFESNLVFAKTTLREGTSKIGDLEIAFNRYEVLLRGEPVDLTAKEFEVLALLAANPGRVFDRKTIAEHLWGEGSEVDNNSITVFIRKIREKIEDNPSRPKYLLTVWSVGYKFADSI